MYEIKRIPEDFIVDEVSDRKLGEGKYSIFLLIKKSYNTEDAIFKISDFLRIPRKNIGYAGAKDRNAITSQYITIFNAPKKDFELKDISVKYVGDTNYPISLGDLEGNKFRITVRNLDKETIRNLDEFTNYFDEQRFSTNNIDIGRAIIKRDYSAACKILIEESSNYSEEIKLFLESHKNAYMNALKIVPKKILLIYVHAYQSSIWNNIVKKLEEDNIVVEEVPLPGFNVEPEKIKKIYYEELDSEGVSPRNFILRDFPEISLEGALRKVKAKIFDLEISALENDELNEGKKKAILKFYLKKGCYATMAVKNMIL